MSSEVVNPPRPPRRILLGRKLAFVLVSLAFVGVLASQTSSGGIAGVVIPFAIAITLQFVPFFWTEEPDPFEPAAIAGLYSALALISTLTVIVVRQRVDLPLLRGIQPSLAESLAEKVAWAHVIGTASYLIGYYSRVGTKLTGIFPRVAGWVWSPRRMAMACAACLFVAVPAYALFQSRVGGSLTDVTNLAAAKSAIQDDPTESWLSRALLIGLLPPMILLSAWGSSKRTRVLVALAIVALAGVLIVRTSMRGVTVYFLMSCAAIYHYVRRRIPVAVVLGAIFFAVAVSNVLLDYRATSNTSLQRGLSMERFRPTEVLEEHEQDRNRLSAMGVVFYTFPDKHDYLAGESWFALITAPIPRWLWPEKKTAFIWRETYMMVHLVGAPVPVPYIGLLYANFSWPGIVLGMMGWGSVQRSLYEWLKRSRQDKSAVLLYANLLLVGSPTLFAFQAVIQYVLPLYVILVLISSRRRAATATQ